MARHFRGRADSVFDAAEPRYRPRSSGKPGTKHSVDAQALFLEVLKKLGYNNDHYAVFEIWDRLLGAQAANARAIGLKGQRLCVEVDSNARLHDMSLRKRDLLRKINQHFGERRVISDIIFQLSGRPTGDVKRDGSVFFGGWGRGDRRKSSK